jgi:hypothetical protein
MFRWGVAFSQLCLHCYDLIGALADDADPESRVLAVVSCKIGVELRLPLLLVEHQVDGPWGARVLVLDVGHIAVGACEAQGPVADVAVHQEHLAAVLQELVEEVPDADLLPGHCLLVEVGEEALGLVQYDHVVA